MKKRYLLLLIATVMTTITAMARPAHKGIARIQQPDGSSLSIRLVGDEYLSYNTTADGYSIVRNDAGTYVYARLDNGQLVPTALQAHDAVERSAAEKAYLSEAGRLAPQMSSAMAAVKQRDEAQRSRALSARRASRYDYSKFRGLVILVEFNDCSFRYDDYADIMDHMINDDDYTGTTRTNFTYGGQRITCTGSMRDYFRDNSTGVFMPHFDVVGPVKVNRSQFWPRYNNGQSDHYGQLMIEACTAADSIVNFKDYDVNGDGMVDMIYFIFAGLPSYIEGNDARLLWPHQSDLIYYGTTRKDGVRLGRYACSTELFGTSEWSVLEGIGTMCHEFSHVLGLPDFYDTGNDFPDQCPNPEQWSVMANGADYDYGRTPCAYSLFERYALGFATPEKITAEGSFTLEHVAESNTGYRIDTPQRNEYFLLENRQQRGWDARLPGHGMLVFRVDSTNSYVWMGNTVNDNPNHPYYQLLCAGGTHTYMGYYVATASDPFPGMMGVNRLDNETSPANLLSWAGRQSPFGLRNIREQNRVVSFDVFDAMQIQTLSLSEELTLAIGSTVQLTPTRSPENIACTFTWTTDNPDVATVSNSGLVTGIGEGVATITVTANGTISATCTVTVLDMQLIPDIAAFRAMDASGEGLLQLTDAEVLHVKSPNIYIRDASGSIILSGTGLSVKKNDRLSGTIYGRLDYVNRMPRLSAVIGKTTTTGVVATEGSAVAPHAKHLSQLTEQDYDDMIILEKVQLERDGGIFAVHGDRRLRLYNTLSVSSPRIVVPTDITQRYDIIAIYGTNTLNGEVIDELYLLQSPTVTSYTEPTALALPESVVLTAGHTLQLSPELTPSGADIFADWTSSDESVATIDQNGLLSAVADGQTIVTLTDLETGLKAECVVTVGELPSIDGLAAFRALPAGSEARLTLSDAHVTYVSKSGDVYLRDASSSIVMRNSSLHVAKDDVVAGTLNAIMTFETEMPVLKPVEGTESQLTVSGTAANEPREVRLSQLTDADLADFVLVKAAQFISDGGVWAVEGDARVRVYNTLGVTSPRITVPSNYAGKYFDVTAIYGTNTVGGNIVRELYLLRSPVEVAEPDAIVGVQADGDASDAPVYNLKGQRVDARYHGLVVRGGRKVLSK